MLRHTFLHLPGIGARTEHLLWNKGILSWDDALASPESLPARCRNNNVLRRLEESVARLEEGDAHYFESELGSSERWRLYHGFADQAVALDIETTGLSQGFSYITVIGLFDGKGYRAFVQGENLDEFPDAIREYRLIITFNGAGFDLPFIRGEMGDVFDGIAHLDIMYPLRRLGYTGGLKKIERDTDMARQSDLQDLDGWDAVRLWRLHQKGHGGALDTLIRYNAEDVAVLPCLADLTYNLMIGKLPLDVDDRKLAPRVDPDLPYDLELLEWMKGAPRDFD